MTIAKFNARALLDLGLDKPTVLALQHMLTQTGNEVGARTLPQLARDVVSVQPVLDAVVEVTNEQPPPFQMLPDANDEQPGLHALAAEVAQLRTEIEALKQGITL